MREVVFCFSNVPRVTYYHDDDGDDGECPRSTAADQNSGGGGGGGGGTGRGGTGAVGLILTHWGPYRRGGGGEAHVNFIRTAAIVFWNMILGISVIHFLQVL